MSDDVPMMDVVVEKRAPKVTFAAKLEETKTIHNFTDMTYWKTDPLIPEARTQKVYDVEVPKKAHYSNLEITTG